MPELNPEHLRAVMNMINTAPFSKHLSLKLTGLGIGYSVVEIELSKEHMNANGGVHGGVYSAGIDTACYWAPYCELPEGARLVSMDLKLDFLGPISSPRITIKGQTIKSGKTVSLAEARIIDVDGKVLGHGTSKLMVIQGKQKYTDPVNLPPKFLGS